MLFLFVSVRESPLFIKISEIFLFAATAQSFFVTGFRTPEKFEYLKVGLILFYKLCCNFRLHNV